MHMTDSLGRSWQLGTFQLDYNFPERFELTYTGADNAEHQPVMIHRALMGSYERFIGILLEHLGGELPVWLAPVQAIVLPIADRHDEHAANVAGRIRAAGLRVELDDRTESVGRKIRDAELRKIPLHAGRRRPRAGGDEVGCASTGAETRGRSRSRRSSSAWTKRRKVAPTADTPLYSRPLIQLHHHTRHGAA